MAASESLMNQPPPQMVAGFDLGSNSFHMIVARVDDEGPPVLHVVDKLRETVRLAAGLDEERRIEPAAQERALACLQRFGQRLKEMPPSHVRAVGTNTLRQAANGRAFLAAAHEALGHRIEIISGTEEARLIYLGVAHSLPAANHKRLVIDIGGGSTECVIGERFEPLQRDSLFMGCVSYSQRFFPNGKLSKERMREAQIAAGLELRPIIKRFERIGWEACIGASGTVLAVGEVLRANGWHDGAITAKGLKKLKKAIVSAGDLAGLAKLQGLAADRAPVLPGGVAILASIVEGLKIDRLTCAQGALREGLLYDLLGRMHEDDARDTTVEHLLTSHRVDREQAERVAHTATAMLRQVRRSWHLGDDHEQLLGWAALLHEIGLSVAYTGYHKHGAYLIQNSDMPGFSREEQELLAQLVRNHRRKLKMRSGNGKTAQRLAVLLRLATTLHRERSEKALAPFALAASRQRLHLSFPESWLEEHPLTRADLKEEADRMGSAGIELEIS